MSGLGPYRYKLTFNWAHEEAPATLSAADRILALLGPRMGQVDNVPVLNVRRFK